MKPAETEILLESGTNELEILEFCVGGNRYGINVAKVRELLQYQPVQQMPHAQATVEGVICPRNELLTVIDLAAYLNHPPSERTKQDIFIVTEFNQSRAAFHVHQVMGIHRISWELIEKPDSAIFGGEDGVVTGVAKLSGNLISILDFEKIMVDINPNTSVEVNASFIDSPVQTDSSHRILVAEDSMVLRKMILNALHKAGYTNTVVKENGQEAWDYLQGLKEEDGPAWRQVSCVITDIEMPKMDGHHLTKRIKGSSDLSKVPVVIFSSLISDEMMLKGREVGADAQLSKPQIHLLVDRLRELIV
ncbi:MAG TPA: chemotaxis protein [Anaerovoracaceae bacterium]|nr:chemotaxis protein [Anaerovoracaceae bacterium]